MTSHYILGFVTILHDFGGVCGTAYGHFLLGSHNFMVMACWLMCEVALTQNQETMALRTLTTIG